MQIESFDTLPLQQVIPAFVYAQYSDDSDVQAFFTAYNTLAQGYLDWFNNTPFGLYTSSFVSDLLLDWLAQGVYGIERPVISTLSTHRTAGMNSATMNSLPMNELKIIQGGTASLATDDIFKRVLTWILFKGDGVHVSIPWIRKRIARFLNGSNGSDVSLDYLLDVSINIPTLSPNGQLGTVPMNTIAMNTRQTRSAKAANTLQIVLPSSTIAQQFMILLQEGYLPVPFQMTFEVKLI